MPGPVAFLNDSLRYFSADAQSETLFADAHGATGIDASRRWRLGSSIRGASEVSEPGIWSLADVQLQVGGLVLRTVRK
jgi:hypothetical protein